MRHIPQYKPDSVKYRYVHPFFNDQFFSYINKVFHFYPSCAGQNLIRRYFSFTINEAPHILSSLFIIMKPEKSTVEMWCFCENAHKKAATELLPRRRLLIDFSEISGRKLYLIQSSAQSFFAQVFGLRPLIKYISQKDYIFAENSNYFTS